MKQTKKKTGGKIGSCVRYTVSRNEQCCMLHQEIPGGA